MKHPTYPFPTQRDYGYAEYDPAYHGCAALHPCSSNGELFNATCGVDGAGFVDNHTAWTDAPDSNGGGWGCAGELVRVDDAVTPRRRGGRLRRLGARVFDIGRSQVPVRGPRDEKTRSDLVQVRDGVCAVRPRDAYVSTRRLRPRFSLPPGLGAGRVLRGARARGPSAGRAAPARRVLRVRQPAQRAVQAPQRPPRPHRAGTTFSSRAGRGRTARRPARPAPRTACATPRAARVPPRLERLPVPRRRRAVRARDVPVRRDVLSAAGARRAPRA